MIQIQTEYFELEISEINLLINLGIILFYILPH